MTVEGLPPLTVYGAAAALVVVGATIGVAEITAFEGSDADGTAGGWLLVPGLLGIALTAVGGGRASTSSLAAFAAAIAAAGVVVAVTFHRPWMPLAALGAFVVVLLVAGRALRARARDVGATLATMLGLTLLLGATAMALFGTRTIVDLYDSDASGEGGLGQTPFAFAAAATLGALALQRRERRATEPDGTPDP